MKKTTLVIMTVAMVLGMAISVARAEVPMLPNGLITPMSPEAVAQMIQHWQKVPIATYMELASPSKEEPKEETTVPTAPVEENADVPAAQEEKIDSDGDEIADDVDVCPENYDPNQADTDDDGVGDICDNCRFVSNPDQARTISPYMGDACVPAKVEESESEDETKDAPEEPPITPMGFDNNEGCSMIPQAEAGMGSIFTGIMWLASMVYMASRRKSS